MLRSSRSPQSSSSALSHSAGPSRSRCLGFINPRTATLLLALLGVIAHLQTFRHLEALYDTFPQLPKPRSGNGMPPSLASHDRVFGLQHPQHPDLQPITPSRVVLDSELNAIPHGPIVVDSKASESLPTSDEPAQVSNSATKPPNYSAGAHVAAMALSSEDVLALVKPTRWFNLLPKRPWNVEGKITPEDVAIWRAQQASQDEERKSWEAARTLTKAMRVYAIVSVIACALGIYGVLKSNLSSLRIFVASAFVDVFLFALSVVSMCIIVTYPEIRAMLCEQISSGELHALLGYMQGVNVNNVSPAAAEIDQGLVNASVVPVAAAAVVPSASSPSPAASFISYATESLWKRAADVENTELAASQLSWWDTLIDNMLENESCDDIFVSVLVPLGLLVCLFYLALRIHFLFVIRNYYTTVLRQYYLLSSTSAESGLDGIGRLDTPMDEKKGARKYSTSSSSSSTTVEANSFCGTGAGRAKSKLDRNNEKLA